MAPKPFRIVRLNARGGTASPASKAKMQLLTYKMALAQPGATVPLLKDAKLPVTQSALEAYGGGDGDSSSGQQHSLDVSRRWVRDADELCVASIRRSNNINKINTYVATYKFDDPHWRPLLLPAVHVLPARAPSPKAGDGGGGSSSSTTTGGGAGGQGGGHGDVTADAAAAASASSSSSPAGDGFDVYIDYNKMLSVELLSRHANFSLRHLVQKGHAMYFVNYAQHSILEMRGLVEASYITCSYGIKGERLRTHMLHVGPLDVRDVMELDAATGRVSFNLQKKSVRRGVVAVSTVEGYGTWFQRKPMLWQRTRRVGALQSQMGAFEYELCPSETVGRVHDHEVSLLEPHVKTMGASGGAEAVGIIASSQVAQNDRLYLGQFEAPVITALDAVHQLAHRTALHNRLLHPMRAAGDAPEGAEHRRRLAMERLLPVSWVTRTPPPYVPLEADLPFRLQVAKPAVFRTETPTPGGVVYPTGGTVGSPMVKGVPLSLFEYNVHQGADHYIYDDAPSARPTKWWSQKSTMPYNGYMYCMRSGLLDYVVPAESFTNPLEAPSAAAHRRSSATSQQWKRERRRRLRSAARRIKKERQAAARAEEGESAAAENEAADDALEPTDTREHWRRGDTDLLGHDAASLAEEAALVAAEEEQRFIAQRRAPLSDVVPPSEKAAERAARYERVLVDAADEKRPAPLRGPEALLQRQARQRKLRRQKKRQAQEEEREGPSSSPE